MDIENNSSSNDTKRKCLRCDTECAEGKKMTRGLCRNCYTSYWRLYRGVYKESPAFTIEAFLQNHPHRKFKHKSRENDFDVLVPGFVICGPTTESLAGMVRKLALTKSGTILIEGPTGTGKEGVARALHLLSPRKANPLICVSCAGLSSDLASSELFGHKRGAFTGAANDTLGLFGAAAGGTLFLDDVETLPLEVQKGLLRVLDTGEVRQVGSTKTRCIEVRVIAASNRDLVQMCDEGTFRSDLYHRLQGYQIRVPGLHHRKDEIPVLVKYILRHVLKSRSRLTQAALDVLQWYEWPGNIRQLINVLRGALLMADTSVDVEHLPDEIKTTFGRRALVAVAS